MNKEENKTAFPTLTYDQTSGQPNGHEKGMTLRDHFAAKAMQSCITLLSPTDINNKVNQDWVSEIGYKVADAMLKQREL